MDPVLVAIACYRVIEVDWSSSGGSDDFIAFKFAAGTVRGYLAEQTAAAKRLNVDDGLVVPVMHLL